MSKTKDHKKYMKDSVWVIQDYQRRLQEPLEAYEIEIFKELIEKEQEMLKRLSKALKAYYKSLN